MSERENFAFVMNVASVEEESYELAEGHVLRRATDDEVAQIKHWVEKLRGSRLFLETLWEGQLPMHGQIIRLPPTDWRYYVISFKGTNSVVLDIQAAADLAPVEVEIGFTLVGEGGVTLTPSRFFHVLENASTQNDFFVRLSNQDLRIMATICRQLQHSDDLLISTRGLARQVGGLKALAHGSPLRFLGYFAVLESLLTHAPKPSDPYESITRQVKKKITLLNNRWERPIDYSPFHGTEPEKIWTKMYEYRSLLAHGKQGDFVSGLQALRSHKDALLLLKETVKAVIRHALSEPRLLLDLREC